MLGPQDPPPFERAVFGRRYPALVVCDHASCVVPASLGDLGLPEQARRRHIGWDIGAAALADALARRLGLPRVSAGYSRLVIDCNRALTDPTSIVERSDGDLVPGNLGLAAAQRAQRAREIFEPYHDAVDRTLLELRSDGVEAPALVSVHSFTPVMRGQARRWHCGVLWDRDPRIAQPLIEALRAEPGLVVGDNEPYSGRDPADYTIDRHAESRGWPHVCLEVRQDLLESAAGVAEWSERLARLLDPLLARPTLYRQEFFSPQDSLGGTPK